MPLEEAERRWIDARFTALDQRITYVNGLPVKVAELTARLNTVEHELTHEQGAVPRLMAKLDEVTQGPAKRREGLAMTAVGAFIGVAGGALFVALLTGGIH
jgi:hypothetical protein